MSDVTTPAPPALLPCPFSDCVGIAADRIEREGPGGVASADGGGEK